jgi:hypothetical protein
MIIEGSETAFSRFLLVPLYYCKTVEKLFESFSKKLSQKHETDPQLLRE